MFRKGQVLKADDLNMIVDAVIQALRITASAPLEVSKIAGTTHLRWAGALGGANMRIGKLASGIDARDDSGTPTMSSETVSLYEFDPETGELTDTGDTVEAWNVTGAICTNGKFVLIVQEQLTKEWFVIVEDCA